MIYRFFNYKIYIKFIKKIIYMGFIPYLTTALGVFNSQLGRWMITFSLGTIILGKTFLPTLFVTLVSVFPATISNLFYPKIIEKYEKKENDELRNVIKQEFYLLFTYYVTVIVLTLLFTKYIVKFFLPSHTSRFFLLPL